MFNYYELLTDVSVREVEQMKARIAAGELHPMAAKIDLGKIIVRSFHSGAAAEAAANEFNRVVRQKEEPQDIETIPLPDDLRTDTGISIDKLLARLGLAESTSDAARKRKAGAVVIDGEKWAEPKFPLNSTAIHTIQVGKKWRRVFV